MGLASGNLALGLKLADFPFDARTGPLEPGKGADNDEVLEYVTSALLKKLLHEPSVRLRQAGESSDREFIAVVSDLFGLDGKDDS